MGIMSKCRSECLAGGQETGGQLVVCGSLAALSCPTPHSTEVPFSPQRSSIPPLGPHHPHPGSSPRWIPYARPRPRQSRYVRVCRGCRHGEERLWGSPFSFPILTLGSLPPQRRTLPGCPFMVACAAAWQLSRSA